MLEERKLFVAGLPQQTREGDLRGHFARYGEVVHTRVVLDMASGNSRGFGFVEFADEAATLRALADDEMPNHVFRGRKVDVKRAERRHDHKQTSPSIKNQNDSVQKNQFIFQKKVFVGGLHETVTVKDLISYFEKFGTITDAVVMRNRTTNRARGFGFISFDSHEAVCKILLNRFHNLNGRDVEVKIAVPKSPTYSEAKYYHMRMDMSLSPITYYDGMVHVHPYTPYTFGCVTPLAHLTHSGYGYGGPIDYSCYAYGGPIGHQHDLVGSYYYAKDYSKTTPIDLDTTDTTKK
ncbi:heterogeneous nuclear ribonucleoprotein 1 isoform X1 [Oryza sativa Japonica Group]|uniref:RNA binding protein n=1 Tax=Oryza sativa subsp. japonica TaxID=39947 RepID=Q75KB4_ORYSJ|nr:putative RNA binding protein [Oryza sativa Japonica Group]